MALGLALTSPRSEVLRDNVLELARLLKDTDQRFDGTSAIAIYHTVPKVFLKLWISGT